MNDPYKVLGIPRNATDEEVKAAYLGLVKKFHPDNYANNPLSDLANEKTQEINGAYDAIMNDRRGKTNNSYNSSYNNSTYQNNYQSSPEFIEIRNLINSKQITKAEEMLDRVPEQSRSAEWYFLKGNVFYSRGWLDESLNHFRKASEMNPSNAEYRSAYNNLYSQRSGHMNGNPNQAYRTNRNAGGCSACDVCNSLICADCCCECMGGDIISCC